MSNQTIVTFVLFSLEAYLHFVIGRGQLALPTLDEAIKIFSTVFIFSLISTRVTEWMTRSAKGKSEREHGFNKPWLN